MPEVQNVGTVDYAQYQPSQYAQEPDYYTDAYNLQPEAYNENLEEMKAASKSRLGATIAAAAIIGGLAVWGGHAWGKKSASKEIEKAKEAIENYEKAQKTIQDAQKAMEEVETMANEKAGKFFGSERCGRGLRDKIEELFKPFKKAADDGAKDAEKKVEEAADNTKKVAEDAAENA